jgi:hypothetical protein
MTEQLVSASILPSDKFSFTLKVLKAEAVDNSRRHSPAKGGDPARLVQFRASMPGRTLQTRIMRNGAQNALMTDVIS